MLKSVLVAVSLALAGPACAADAVAPVRAIMDVATALWSNADGEAGDYFDDAHIGNFSEDVRGLYAEAIKHPAFDTDEETGNPFDYDPIILGQDGCPLDGLTVQAGKTDGVATDVVVRFKRFSCMEGSSDEERNAVSEIHFRVISERGRPVIADVISGEGDDRSSLTGALKDIIGS
ncbi:MAG: hypothetical protein H6Q99_2752 [Proteobacteria bacterium]|nr:hypothetical protein [Pseudomonadota bacterium]